MMNTKTITRSLVLFFASFVFLNAGATRINIGGLFPLISDHGSGKHELAAVMLAFSQVNNKTDGVADTVLADFQARLEKSVNIIVNVMSGANSHH